MEPTGLKHRPDGAISGCLLAASVSFLAEVRAERPASEAIVDRLLAGVGLVIDQEDAFAGLSDSRPPWGAEYPLSSSRASVSYIEARFWSTG